MYADVQRAVIPTDPDWQGQHNYLNTGLQNNSRLAVKVLLGLYGEA